MNKITHKPKHLDWIWLWDIRDVVYQNAQGTIYLLIYCFVSLFFFSSLVESLIQYVGIIVRYTRIGVYLYLSSLFLFFFSCAGQHFGRAN